MSGLISSLIELEEHQAEVVKRVLQDPVQRYLLADEVGLGKMIEAGVLIGQYTLDAPADHRVLVVAPPPLVMQWRRELRRRFLLGHLLGESIRVVSLNAGIKLFLEHIFKFRTISKMLGEVAESSFLHAKLKCNYISSESVQISRSGS